ncbi:MAG: cob(I)yrinic acid a,c-diamide adenosyltransferase [Candidatus Fermentibacteria bacterium]
MKEGAMTGKFQLYTGNGKGKTTAALGLAVRAACAGKKVYIGQFMKGQDYSELCLPEHFPGFITMEQYGTPRLLCKGEEPSEEDLLSASAGLERIGALMLSGSYDLVIADELNVTVHMGLLDENDVMDFILQRPDNVELVLTGRYAPENFVEAADLVTEMREVKHYYAAENLQARKGIES